VRHTAISFFLPLLFLILALSITSQASPHPSPPCNDLFLSHPWSRISRSPPFGVQSLPLPRILFSFPPTAGQVTFFMGVFVFLRSAFLPWALGRPRCTREWSVVCFPFPTFAIHFAFATVFFREFCFPESSCKVRNRTLSGIMRYSMFL